MRTTCPDAFTHLLRCSLPAARGHELNSTSCLDHTACAQQAHGDMLALRKPLRPHSDIPTVKCVSHGAKRRLVKLVADTMCDANEIFIEWRHKALGGKVSVLAKLSGPFPSLTERCEENEARAQVVASLFGVALALVLVFVAR